MNLLFWITSSVKQAVVKGFAEAFDELGLEADAEPDAVARLQGRVNKPAALESAPASERVASRKSK